MANLKQEDYLCGIHNNEEEQGTGSIIKVENIKIELNNIGENTVQNVDIKTESSAEVPDLIVNTAVSEYDSDALKSVDASMVKSVVDYPSVSEIYRPAVPARSEDEGSDLDFDESPTEATLFTEGGRDIPTDEDLEDSHRSNIYAVEMAMDEEVDRLTDVSTSFIWEKDFKSFHSVREEFTGPTPGPVKEYDSPYDAFTDIWTRDIIEHIARETNRFAKQTIDDLKAEGTLTPSSRLNQWTYTDADDIMVLFSVFMCMGIVQRASLEEYWKPDGCLEMPKFRHLMTYNRFILLSKFLHFVDNTEMYQMYLKYGDLMLSPKLSKLAPVISHLNAKFSSLYSLSRDICIDEYLTLFKGRLSWAQTMGFKNGRSGTKSYELCEAHSGYLYKFHIYPGNSDNASSSDLAPSADLGTKSIKLVLDLLKGLEHRGHCLTMDNFYNCPSLARYLKSKGFDCLGTLRPTRKNVPHEIAIASKDISKGTIIARHCGDVSVIAWKDSKLLTMISTYHNADTCIESKADKPLVKPICVRDYNRTITGVDMKDEQLTRFLLERKRAVKWYVRIFKRLLNASIHNAFVLYSSSLKRKNETPMTLIQFRYALAESIAQRHHPGLPKVLDVGDKRLRLRLDILHTPKYGTGKNNRRRCVICYRKNIRRDVLSQCLTCGVHVCFGDCWISWHSLAELEGQDSPEKEPRSKKARKADT